MRIVLVALPVSIQCWAVVQGTKNLPNSTIATLIFFITMVAAFEGARYLIYRSRTWFASKRGRWKRMPLIFPLGAGYMSLVFIAGKLIRNQLNYGEWKLYASTGSSLYINNTNLTEGVIGSSIFFGIFCFTLASASYGILYHFQRLRHAEKERERLEKEKLMAELQQLKGIVNPHFLFNNLNSLSSLICENPAEADAFLNELTKVFRYLLRNHQSELTTLQQELQFLHSYYHLLKTRYGAGLSMEVATDAELDAFLLPPLTLQLLVENAVKHNTVHKDQPLRIEIRSEGQNLVVRNTLCARKLRAESTGIGLHTINTRYRLLNRKAPSIEHGSTHFLVSIPLIEPELSPLSETEASLQPQSLLVPR
ncbi:MAG TPA: sensor histidine kinase [Flavisolibacter sp.]|nr:sensor histidine kinase [Flavisolibacter sp.]